MDKQTRDVFYAFGALGAVALLMHLNEQRTTQKSAADIIADAKKALDPLRTPVKLPV
jgi:hypothetical protein